MARHVAPFSLNGLANNALRNILQDVLRKEFEAASDRMAIAVEFEVRQLYNDTLPEERTLSRHSAAADDRRSCSGSEASKQKRSGSPDGNKLDMVPGTLASVRAVDAPYGTMSRHTTTSEDDFSASSQPKMWARRSNAVERELESRRRRRHKCKSVISAGKDASSYTMVSEFDRAVPLADRVVRCDPTHLEPVAACHVEEAGSKDTARALIASSTMEEPDFPDDLQEEFRAPRISRKRVEGGCFSEQWFDKAAGVLILLNAILLSVETDWMARNWLEEMPLYFDMMDFCFCVLFTIELGFRISMRGCEFFYMKGWEWNYFDFAVVSMQIMETAFMLSKYFGFTSLDLKSSTGSLRIMRVARLFRTLRLVRAVHLIRELHTIFKAIVKAIRSLAWTIVLLLLMMFIVGVSLTQMVTDYKLNVPNPDHNSDLEYFYGTLGRSVMSLYMMISQGLQWRDASDPLAEEISYIPVIIVLFYITFTIFGLTNIVTSVFVESVIQAREESGRDALLHHVNSAFATPDEDIEGAAITLPEFQRHMKDAEMMAYLKAIDLSPNDASELFKLLDTTAVGKIPLEDFLSGCMRLQGTAKALDLAILTWEHREAARRMEQAVESVSLHVAQLASIVQSPSRR